ncbi:hypothetical protein A0H81_13087 [Grifola frondosa]|uniref:Uncharacterized protein n=1 Tax=Grifola frondosa TaxID=5627 RepID=A0A1C7LQC7_GRIFR|nr:hypothetical protein A0H81_13087 [Grifola frondosa]
MPVNGRRHLALDSPAFTIVSMPFVINTTRGLRSVIRITKSEVPTCARNVTYRGHSSEQYRQAHNVLLTPTPVLTLEGP